VRVTVLSPHTGLDSEKVGNEMDETKADINMADVLGKSLNDLDPVERAEHERRKAEYARLANEKVMFRGVERRRGEFCSFADEPLGVLSWSGFTVEETQKATELAKPFNDLFCDDSENSMSMFARWMDAGGFIFCVDDELTGTTLEVVHEKNLETFLAERKYAAKH
jgi:hypothetical protein